MESSRANSSDRVCNGGRQARQCCSWLEGKVCNRSACTLSQLSPITTTWQRHSTHKLKDNGASARCTLKVVWHIALQSKTHVVLATLRRSPDEMSSHQLKMFKIDDHLGLAISGLNSDGRSLSRYMRTETLNHRCAPVCMWSLHSARLQQMCVNGSG